MKLIINVNQDIISKPIRGVAGVATHGGVAFLAGSGRGTGAVWII